MLHEEFEKRVKSEGRQENLEWDGYIEWEAYEESLTNLRQRSKAIDDAINTEVA